MTYEEHLRLAIVALKRAVPGISDRRISLKAGLHAKFVGEFLANGSATITRASAVKDAIGELCPLGDGGSEVRRLLSMMTPSPAAQEDAA